MRVIIKKVDNPKAKHRENSTRDLQLFNGRAIFNYVDGSDKFTITSPIKRIVIQTLNTKYECEVVNDDKEGDLS